MSDRPSAQPVPDPAHLPRHVAVIMDGNGRWARARGLPRLAGHRAGTKALRRLLEACVDVGIPVLTIFAWSTENWKRPAHEVRGMMYLLEEVIDRQLDELDASGVRIRHVGWLEHVPPHLAAAITRAVDRTAGNERLALNVAFNYGGRAEIVRAARRIVEEGIPAGEIDEACFERHLETCGLPDPDLVIRTSGEMRLSNFLLWQAAYSEIYCTDTLWPDFDRATLLAAIASYARRERRYGRVSERAEVEVPSTSGTAPRSEPVS
jgi:undecaprenyl diphosphate synthase